MDDIAGGFKVLLIFVGLSTPIIICCLYAYLKKRLEHKEIMAAIEKGIAPSAIPTNTAKPTKSAGPLWIKSLTTGITFLIIAAGLVFISYRCDKWEDSEDLLGFSIAALVLFAIGISRVIRAILQRQAEKQLPNGKQSPAPN